MNLSKRSLFVFYPVHDVIGEDDIVETARKLFAVAYLKRDVFQRSVVSIGNGNPRRVRIQFLAVRLSPREDW